MEKYKEIEKIIDISKIKYNEPMKLHTSVKVGGKCDIFVSPENVEDVINSVKFAKENNIEYFVIGCGSNLLVTDDDLHAMVIPLGNKFSKIDIDGEYVTALSGTSMPYFANFVKNNLLSGFEFACGIPGTIGGGVRMNAGAYGSEIANVFEEATFLDKDLNLCTIKKEDMDFSYRHTFFSDKKEYIIISAKFKLKKEENDIKIKEKMEENRVARVTKQPLEYPNFGSTFKRPEGYFVGKLIQDAGLKGYKIGGAQVSTKHTGFIVNVDNATCKDIVDLIHYIQEVVYEKYGVKLETEVVYIGGKI